MLAGSIANGKLATDPLDYANMTAPVASVAFNSQKLTGLADGVADSDAATKGQVDVNVPVVSDTYSVSPTLYVEVLSVVNCPLAITVPVALFAISADTNPIHGIVPDTDASAKLISGLVVPTSNPEIYTGEPLVIVLPLEFLA
tara:strand:- start:222 stop:650 length:429 start_codon:yes stop_codon:yes gene_type:complete